MGPRAKIHLLQHSKIKPGSTRKFSRYICENSAGVHAKIQQVCIRKFRRCACENSEGVHAKIQQVNLAGPPVKI